MKLKTAAVICLAMMVLLSACNKNTPTDNTVPTSTPQITASPTPRPKLELTPKEDMTSRLIILMRQNKAFDVGDYLPGEIPEGEYAYIGTNSSKYYCEEDIAGNIIDNENFQSFGYVYVHGIGNVETKGLLVNVDSFEKLGISGAKELYEIMTEQPDYNQGGMYKIGFDIPAGLYTLESIGEGYFELDNGPVGNNEIINNDHFNGRKQISAQNGQYLKLSRIIISE